MSQVDGGVCPRLVEAWVAKNARVACHTAHGAVDVHVSMTLPADSQQVFEIITHPDNAEVYRGVERCTLRRVIHNDGRGTQLLQVENESEWNFLGLVKGAVRTRLIVQQDMQRGMMHFTLAPGHPSMMRELYGRWDIAPAPPDVDAPPPPFPQPAAAGLERAWCIVTLRQRFAPRNVPFLLMPAFRAFALKQIVHNFEDLVSEVGRQQQGRHALPPYMHACMREIVPPPGDPSAAAELPVDPTSVLSALEAASAASSCCDGDRSARSSLDGWAARAGGGAGSPCGSPRRAALPPSSAPSSPTIPNIASARDAGPESHPLPAAGLELASHSVERLYVVRRRPRRPRAPAPPPARPPAAATGLWGRLRAAGAALRELALDLGIVDDPAGVLEDPDAGWASFL